MHMSHNHQTPWVVWIFHRENPNIVLKNVGVMRLACGAFNVFDHPDTGLTRIVEQRIFHMCDLVIVSWPPGVDPLRL
jgi:hypothetical protein